MSAILLYFLYIVIVISNLNVAREPNELARAINKPSRAAIFAHIVNEPSRASSFS